MSTGESNDRARGFVRDPTHDRWALLSRGALPSELGQTDVEHEVIVVDDGSRDETPDRLAEVEHPRLVVIRHDRPRGVSAARNAGIAAARGAWVAFLDDDDLWAPHKLRVQLDAARVAGAEWVYGSAVVVDEHGVSYEVPAPPPGELLSLLRLRSAVPAGASNVVVTSERIRSLGGFDPRLSGPEDWDMWLRLATVPAASCSEILVAYTAHRDNVFARTSWRRLAPMLSYLASKHRAAGVDLDVGRFGRWAAFERFRTGRRLGAASLLLWLGLRYGRPRYAFQAMGVLAPWRPTRRPGADVEEPEWLRRHRRETGWPRAGEAA